MNFTVNTNHPVIMSSVADQELLVPDSKVWTYGAGIANDPENLPVISNSIKVNGSAVIPSWLINDPSTFSFSIASSANTIAGVYIITLISDDGFNTPSEINFTLTINENLAPIKNKVLDNHAIVNFNLLNYEMYPVDILFSDPDNRTMTPHIRQANGDPLPSFLNFNILNNTLSGIPLDLHVGTWNLEYVAVDDNDLEGVIPFKVTVKPCFYK